MTFDQFIALRNDPRRPLALGIYRVEAPARPSSLPSRRPAPPPPPRHPFVAAARPVGHRTEPTRVCLACHEPAFLVGRTLMCERCAAEVRWRISLAQSGLRVVS
jgi:hypothetical protein